MWFKLEDLVDKYQKYFFYFPQTDFFYVSPNVNTGKSINIDTDNSVVRKAVFMATLDWLI